MPVTAKLFKHRGNQDVSLPKEFQLPGKGVRISRVGRGVLLEPILPQMDVETWFAMLDEYRGVPFMEEGRQRHRCRRRRISSTRDPPRVPVRFLTRPREMVGGRP